ncbi:MAG: GspH/FimT family pseudopilin [Rhodanobacteraceae bacterium]|nr:GspH/FimT family pseudopilin [Rhodanobacteraceae bacterium]
MAFLYRRNRSLHGRKTERGFTLLEIFIAVVILAILVGLAMPMFRDVIRNTNVSNQTNDLVTALSIARSEAVRRGVRVAVVSDSGASDWSSGWRVIADRNGDGVYELNPAAAPGADEVISRTAATGAQYRVYAKAAAGADNRIVFNANGALATTGFDINICYPTGDASKSRRVRVRASGSVSSHKNTSGSSATACTST